MINWIHKYLFPVEYKIVQDHYIQQRMIAVCEAFRKVMSPRSNIDDLIDFITDVSPIESPWYDFSKSKATVHQWWGQPWEKK